VKKDYKVVKAVLGVLLLIAVVSGMTFAWVTWTSGNVTIYGQSDCFVVDYTKGKDILNGSLNFGGNYSEGLSITVKAKISDSCDIVNGKGTLYLDTKDVTSDYLINNRLVRYQVLEDNTEVKSGTISSKGKTNIYDDFDVTNIEKSFTVYIWVSIDDVTSNNMGDIMASVYSGGVQMSVESR